MSARVLISIVTYNSSRHLRSCIESLQQQTFNNSEIAIWDNGSNDETAAIIKSYRDILSFAHISEANLGFSAAHNRLIQARDSEYVLVLNPDVVMEPDFVSNLISAMEEDSSAGSATGKLLRQTPRQSRERGISGQQIIDSTGVYVTPNQRHFDRGSGEADLGQYENPEYVFGATGAAALYRRAMLEDIRSGTEFFDESFFAYREDVDLAWRAQWMGWRCRYVPGAIGYHERRVLPRNRSTLPEEINMHSFKNRFLLRVKNMDAGTYMRFFLPITFRDAAAVVYVLAREHTSVKGIRLLISAFPQALAYRKVLMQKRRASPREIRSWFSYTPVAKSIRD